MSASVADAVQAVMWCSVGFLVSLPWWMAMLVEFRPVRPVTATIKYLVAVGAPIVVVGLAVTTQGSMSWELAQGLTIAWLIVATLGVAFYWAIATAVPRLGAMRGDGFVGRTWQRESYRWWDAAIIATVIGAAFAPALLFIDPTVGGVIVVVVVAATLLGWIIHVRGIDNRVLECEIGLSLPAMAVATVTPGPTVSLVMLLGVAAAIALAAIASRATGRDERAVAAA